MKGYKIEICANSSESAIIAQRSGADRVELCAGMPDLSFLCAICLFQHSRLKRMRYIRYIVEYLILAQWLQSRSVKVKQLHTARR